MWATYKFKNNKDYKTYTEFNKNPVLALKKVKESLVIPIEEQNMYIIYNSIPAEVCAVLIRDYMEKLSKDEKIYCRGILLEFATRWFNDDYRFQISDGTEEAISVLPILMNEFPQEREDIKLILFLLLFNDYSIGMSGNHCYTYAINSIKMCLNDFDDEKSLLYGYLLLKPKYEALIEKIRIKNHSKGIYSFSQEAILNRFTEEHESDFNKIKTNQITLNDVEVIDQIDLEILQVSFELISSSLESENYKKIVEAIIHAFAKKLLLEDRENKVRYEIKHAFLKQLAYFILQSDQKDIAKYMQPFIDGFNWSEVISDLLKEFIYAEDSLNKYDNFWCVWNLFETKINELDNNKISHYCKDDVVKSYLLASTLWNQNAQEWNSLKDKDRRFFKLTSEKLGHLPCVLFSITKLLNGIGSRYLKDGIGWISHMLSNNENLATDKLESDTLFYLENVVRKYIFDNHDEIKKRKILKDEVIVILNFLIERGSSLGYMLRERIL